MAWDKSDHWNGKHFINPGGARAKGLLDVLRWQLTSRRQPWPKWVPSEPGPPPPAAVGAGSLRITFVNHSTLLIQCDGRNLLTDPVWSRRISPVKFSGPTRHRAPGIRFEDLPQIHDILLSHCHYDHFDRPTFEKLIAKYRPRVITPLGVSRYLKGCDCEELDWWQTTSREPLAVHAVPAQHFSGRTLWDRDRTLWCGYVIETGVGTVYFAGDTAFGPHIAQIAGRFPNLRAACLPAGAFLPRWFMSPVHWDPAEVFEASRILRAELTMAIHFGTFRLADDGPTQGVDELRRLWTLAGLDESSLWIPRFGEGRDFTAAERNRALQSGVQ